MEPGYTRYVQNGAHHLAYALLGDAPVDLLYFGGGIVPYSLYADYPPMASMLDRMGSFARLILADRRGVGASDPVTAEAPGTSAEIGDDLAAVLDAVATDGAAVFAEGMGVPPAIELAAARPDLVTHLVLFNGFAKLTRSDDYPFGLDPSHRLELVEQILASKSEEADPLTALLTPSVANDPVYLRWYNRGGQLGASRSSSEILFNAQGAVDVRALLGHVSVPTLVLHRRNARVFPPEHSRYLAEHIPGARYAELPGADQPPYVGDMALWLDELEQFVVGRSAGAVSRSLATMLFSDIVGSTEQAALVGDRRWRELLDRHDALTASVLARHGGRRITQTGDGALSVFPTPTQAIEAARSLIVAMASLDLRLRVGVHTGEVERRGDNIGGLAVNLAARVMDLALPGEILVSGAVPALTIGSPIDYEPRGTHELRGVPGRWPVWRAVPRSS